MPEPASVVLLFCIAVVWADFGVLLAVEVVVVVPCGCATALPVDRALPLPAACWVVVVPAGASAG